MKRFHGGRVIQKLRAPANRGEFLHRALAEAMTLLVLALATWVRTLWTRGRGAIVSCPYAWPVFLHEVAQGF